MLKNIPKLNSTITFTKIPVGSYAHKDTEYRVNGVDKHYIHINRVDSGAGTYDTIRAYQHAAWITVNPT